MIEFLPFWQQTRSFLPSCNCVWEKSSAEGRCLNKEKRSCLESCSQLEHKFEKSSQRTNWESHSLLKREAKERNKMDHKFELATHEEKIDETDSTDRHTTMGKCK